MQDSQNHSDSSTFNCNICGARSPITGSIDDRESGQCTGCGSTVRLRSIILVLSRTLFGCDIQLPEFPVLKTIQGLGISDSEIYSRRLSRYFSYSNTYFHREPRLDLTNPNPSDFGRYDFVICSEVLEHVESPVERAFEALRRLLKPDGFLIATVPYSLDAATEEHFKDIGNPALAVVNQRLVVVGQLPDGEYKVYDNLVFHGGPGATLEMRLFSETDIRSKLLGVGFPEVRFENKGNIEFGISFTNPCSLPIVATHQPVMLSRASTTELLQDFVQTKKALTAVRESQWLKLGRSLGLGPKLK